MGRFDPDSNYESVVMGLRLFADERKVQKPGRNAIKAEDSKLKLSDVSIPKERSLDR